MLSWTVHLPRGEGQIGPRRGEVEGGKFRDKPLFADEKNK